MPRIRELLTALGVVIGGALWLHDHDARMREILVAKTSADSLRAVIKRDHEARQLAHVHDSLEAVGRIAAADRAARQAQKAAADAAARFGWLLDSLVTLAPDTLDDFIARLRAGWAEVQRRQDSTLAATQARVTERDVRITELEIERLADIHDLELQLAEAMRQLDAANRRARPGVFTRVVQALPWLGVGVLVGLAL